MTTATVSPREDTRAEYRTLGLVSVAHAISHLYWLAFVPILPDLKALLGVSYSDLAIAITTANIVSALTQAPTGFLCDRLGARSLLAAGLALGGLAFIAIGLWPSYPMLIAGAVVIGLANAVYHPADYSILAAEMGPSRIGRAFSIHAFTGYLGFAVTPPIMLAVTRYGGVQSALIVCGLMGPLAAMLFLPGGVGERAVARKRPANADQGPGALALLTPAVILLTIMYTMLNLGTGVLQTYLIVSVVELFHMPRAIADWSLTLFMGAMVAGVLAGGFLADRASRQSLVTSGGFGLAAIVVALLGTFDFADPLALALIALAGFLSGLIVPSRDMLTRAASPPGAIGRVFGIVTTGFNFGGILAPIIGAWFIDHHAPAWIFYSSAIFMAITIGLAIRADANGVAHPAQK
jgi:FSR family fosmidomycin resistance protein-like MFS transporter